MIDRLIKKSWLHAKTKPRFVAALLVWLIVLATPTLADRTPEPIVYTISFSAPENQYAEVEAVIPTTGRPQVELMMAVWSPGFYRVEDYASRVQGLTARRPAGKAMAVQQPRKNRWLI